MPAPYAYTLSLYAPSGELISDALIYGDDLLEALEVLSALTNDLTLHEQIRSAARIELARRL